MARLAVRLLQPLAYAFHIANQLRVLHDGSIHLMQALSVNDVDRVLVSSHLLSGSCAGNARAAAKHQDGRQRRQRFKPFHLHASPAPFTLAERASTASVTGTVLQASLTNFSPASVTSALEIR